MTAPEIPQKGSHLIVVNTFPRNYSSGSDGFGGKVIDQDTGVEYQISVAVRLGSKPKAVTAKAKAK